MGKSRSSYPPEFRQKMVELVRAGRSPAELARAFEPSSDSIRKWVVQADLDEAHENGALAWHERDELHRLRQENEKLRHEVRVWKKAVIWFTRRQDHR